MSQRSSTIGGKLVFASTILLVGFVVIGITYNKSILIKEQILAKTNRLHKFEVLAKEINIILVSAQRTEAEFKASKNIVLIKKHVAQINKIHKLVAELEYIAPSKNELKLLSTFKSSLKQYENTLKSEVVAIAEIGLNKHLGLLGRLDKAIQDIERNIKVSGNTAMLKGLLEISRLQESFLLYTNNLDLRLLQQSTDDFQQLIIKSKLSARIKRKILYNVNQYRSGVSEIGFAVSDLNDESRVLKKDTAYMETQIDDMLKRVREVVVKDKKVSDKQVKRINKISYAVVLGISVIVSMLFLSLTSSIARSLRRLRRTIKRISDGDYAARTNMKGRDELGDVGRSFDMMLNERVTRMVDAEGENERLNDSILELLETVSALSNKDLTVTVPVAEDITGAVGDAINLLTSETAGMLNSIKEVAKQVDETAAKVHKQSDKVSGVAENERKVLGHTVTKLESAAKKMNVIAKHSQNCNQLASDATDSTELALTKVSNAVTGIREIRETISETEKRIKRLGERSQEITQVVEIITNIAERTHVLALNASMQAAAAGEAGRGFAVVADEVQRLAENSQSETAHISELVNSIQVETSGTMAAINKAISQVVVGSEMAEDAGKQMVEAQENTSRLVSSVADIAKASVIQAKINNEIGHSASLVQKSTMATREELSEQMSETENLVVYAANMLSKVTQFKLPPTGQ